MHFHLSIARKKKILIETNLHEAWLVVLVLLQIEKYIKFEILNFCCLPIKHHSGNELNNHNSDL